jgi:hypothetical protein
MRTKKWISRTFGVPYYQLRFADGGTGAGADGADKGDDKGDGKDDSGKDDESDDKKDKGDGDKKFTQDDLDDAIDKRLARERRKWEREHPEAKKSDDDKKDQGKDDKSADDGSAAKIAAANQKLVQAEAKAVALSLGVKSDRVAYAVRMADLSKVDVDDELGVDGETLKKAIEQVLKDIPELKPTEEQKKGSGFKVGADGDKSGGDKKTSLKDAVAAYYKK